MHPKVKIDLVYDDFVYMRKTWFGGWELASDYTGAIPNYDRVPSRDEIKQAQRRTGAKVRRGQTVVLQPNELDQWFIFGIWGHPSGNLLGYNDDPDTIDWLLTQDGVVAIVWSVNGKVIEYATSERKDVPALPQGNDQ